MKKRLTKDEEFEILKLVLDKILWLGFGIMAFGLYQVFASTTRNGFYAMFAGVVILIIFVVIVFKEYEVVKSD
ncbi:hypothetical protein COT48_05460 [Candidatus Woesearchaeota archaeon CG08_land_8_20_14_0_20_47_9]|nr:MAG: hypothetical protein COT48_05460 [Candidatus Woesearchaeota archaeon CG08_land_8_20_14_0_20_47_9]